ncbi:MAG: hypothetical protein IJ897_03375 [Prevotella sp.]|nr:hypothetical protein [Prevotella sp.]
MKFFFIACLMSAGMQTVSAQEATWVPKNVAVGVGVGTTGIVIDASTTIHNYFGVRFGVDIFPKIKVNKDIDLKTEGNNKRLSQLTGEINELNAKLSAAGMETVDLSRYPGGNLPNEMAVQGKWSNTTWHFLVDVYPFGAAHSFHATVGAYFGSSEIISLYNREDGFLQPINTYNEAYLSSDPNVRSVIDQYGLTMIGADMGEYFVTPNPAQNGNLNAYAKVNGFRPYLGIGFGRAVPKKRIGCQFDLGVQFWGKPDVYIPTYNKATGTYQDEKIDADRAGGDVGKVLKNVAKFSVYPVLNFRLVGRIL